MFKQLVKNLLLLTLSGLPPTAVAASAWSLGSNLGQSYSAQLSNIESLPASQRDWSLFLRYQPATQQSWLASTRPLFGLHLALTQNSYTARRIQSEGNGFYLGVQAQWRWPVFWERRLCRNQQAWAFQLSPELILHSRMNTASSINTAGADSELASASISQWQGFGGWAVDLGVLRRITVPWDLKSFDLGLSWRLAAHFFQNKQDQIAVRLPTTGAVQYLKDTRTGSYTLSRQSISLDFNYRLY